MLFVFRILVYINSAANPIIYNAMSAKFRKALLNLFIKPAMGMSTGIIRRHSTFNTTTSSLVSRYSCSSKVIPSLNLKRSLSDAHIRKEDMRYRSASMATTQLELDSSRRGAELAFDFPKPLEEMDINKEIVLRKLKMGAYFSSGSNCSTLHEVPLKTFRAASLIKQERGYGRYRIHSLPNSPLLTSKEAATSKLHIDKFRFRNLDQASSTDSEKETNFKSKDKPNFQNCGHQSSAKNPKLYLKYKILASPVVHLAIL